MIPEDWAPDVTPDRANSVLNKLLPQVIDNPQGHGAALDHFPLLTE